MEAGVLIHTALVEKLHHIEPFVALDIDLHALFIFVQDHHLDRLFRDGPALKPQEPVLPAYGVIIDKILDPVHLLRKIPRGDLKAEALPVVIPHKHFELPEASDVIRDAQAGLSF